MTAPASSYRLQVRPTFDLYAAADACDYLATLGAQAVYLSPLLPSVRGSDHGYDVVAFDTVDPQRGGIDGWTHVLAGRALAQPRRRRRHRAQPHRRGRRRRRTRRGGTCSSTAASRSTPHWFDIDWGARPAAAARARRRLRRHQLESSTLATTTRRAALLRAPLPDRAGTGRAGRRPRPRCTTAALRAGRTTAAPTPSRTTAASSPSPTLAGLRVEDRAGLRRHPRRDRCAGSATATSTACASTTLTAWPTRAATWSGCASSPAPDAWIAVEKILEPGEELPADWPVDGTTGYDALTEVSRRVRRPGRRGAAGRAATASSPATS